MEEERGGGEQKGILLLEAQCSFKGDCCVRPLYSFYSSQRESRLPVPVPVDAGADGDSHRNDDSGSLTCHEELENVRVINAILKDRPGATIFPHHDFNYPRYLPRLFPLVARRVNRPGFNSYLKVVLDDNTIKRLHEMTLKISELVKAEVSTFAVAQGNENTLDKADDQECSKEETGYADQSKCNDSKQEAKNSQKRQKKGQERNSLIVKPRSEASLHMTFFFGGETLCELPASELTEFHSRVTKLFVERNFFQDEKCTNHQGDGGKLDQICSTNAVECAEDAESSTHPVQTAQNLLNHFPVEFRVKELRVFPPRRNNLIVAELEAPSEWHELHDAIRTVAKTADYSSGLRQVTARGKELWTPHITLANVLGGNNKGHRRYLEHLLGEMSNELACCQHAGASVQYVSMGGPVPKQVDLNWKFYPPTVPPLALTRSAGGK